MKKAKRTKKKTTKSSDELLSQFDLTSAVKGKYAKKYREGVSVAIYSPNKKTVEAGKKEGETFVMIEPDIASVFPNADSVNIALRHLIAALPKNRPTKLHSS
jgi:hypothetical protein